MTVDERLRTALHDAVRAHPLDEERALRAVRARVPHLEPAEIAENRVSARVPRVVAAFAACAVIAGAVALPFALHSTRTPSAPAATSGRCGHTVTTGYRSTAVVSMPQEALGTRGPRLLTAPVPTALALCDAVLGDAHPHTDAINFAAETKSRVDLSLIVTTPDRNDTTALARAWALRFVNAVLADAQRQLIEQQHQLSAQERALHERLQHVDAQLARPAGRSSVDELNLALDRIGVQQQLQQDATQSSRLRLQRVKPAAFASLVSESAPVRIPTSSGGSRPVVWIVVGLIAVGVVLAALGFLFGRRSSRVPGP
jgi:hypothetical protein